MFLNNFYKMFLGYYMRYSSSHSYTVKQITGSTMTNSKSNMSVYELMKTIPIKLPSAGSGYQGTHFGNNNTPVTPDDYQFTSLNDKISVSVGLSSVELENGMELKGVYTITNTSSETITISDIGLLTHHGNSGAYFMVERTVLDEPLTLESNGVGQITYIVTLNYPTV